ncbi:hypothetical protein M6B38_114320 [Iris pallida]|uniref:Uncharacterized protein n=1 Tax=Iris pallida TaxID=29817 RepID=A0AAX6DFJ4_IRIPA|nr:hypothetical protein M6B38_249035 [Iris pallida]KAJ6853793.1 hypothetical protein M6B38_114320 [Iris pallida]
MSGQGSKVNYGFSADTNDIGVSGWSSQSKVGNMSNTGVGNGNKVTKTEPAPSKGLWGRLFG